MRKVFLAAPLLMLFAATSAAAHVRIFPADSKAGATENYTMYVPTEGKVNTTSVDLEVPEGVRIVSVEGPAGSYSFKKAGARIVEVHWKMDMPPGQNQAFKFVAINPAGVDHISWMAHQHQADGSGEDWVDVPGSKRPAPVIKLTPP